MDEHEWLAERFEAHRTHLRAVAYRMLGSLSEADDAVQEAWLHLSRSGTSGVENLADAFEDCQRFYAEVGFRDEWKLHHQGGMTGYASREVIATQATPQEIRIGQAFAWNPSITGAKAEDTFVLTDSGPEVITCVPATKRPVL
jgi:hypothetical protein